MAAQDILEQMINDAEGDVEDLQSQIDQIQSLYDELAEQAEAIEDGVLTPAANDLTDYLKNTKIPEIETSYPNNVELVLGPTFNDIPNINSATITDWKIIDSTTTNTVYEYNGIGWDGDTFITERISEWNYGHDYLTHPLTTFDGTYGIYPNMSALLNAINSLTATKNKVANTEDNFGRYI